MPWRRFARGSVAYSTGLPKYRSRFLSNVLGFIPSLIYKLVVKFGPTGLEVDVKDDSLDRWYVTHKKFDPSRNQVRYVMLKAFSNQKAQMKFFDLVNKELQARKLVEEVPRYEHITGGHYQPGYHAQVRENRRNNGGVGSNFVRLERVEDAEPKPEPL